MSSNQGSSGCGKGVWTVAVGAAILAAILLYLIGEWSLVQAVFAGIVIAILLGALLQWTVCRPLPAVGTAAQPVAPPRPEPAAEPAPTATEPASEPAMTAPAAATGTLSPVATVAGFQMKPSKALPGQADLASRKGSWKYTGGAAAEAAKAVDAAPAAEPAPAPAAAAPVAAEEGKRPEALAGPRDGKADDLKRIKGIGPKLETLCNSLGFYHFDQIANWTPAEVAWVDDNLVGFKGRVSRDEWVKQASILAGGGETEFSKRVEGGEVY